MLFCFGNMELQGKEFIRQQWRMWIETPKNPREARVIVNSFASNGECGLKLGGADRHCAGFNNSFASNGECGLKRPNQHINGPLPQFIRQQWRMWIETEVLAHQPHGFGNSFASNGECGLKRRWHAVWLVSCVQFIRQQWRMWIETGWSPMRGSRPINSFASNGECGLKRVIWLCRSA